MTRKPKAYFFEAPDNSQGKKFSRFNHPTKEMFILLFDSVLFPENVEDTMTEQTAGHAKLTTDDDAMNRIASYKDGHSRVVRPEQMPMLIVNEDDTEAFPGEEPHVANGIKLTPVEKIIGTRKRLSFRLAAQVTKSLEIDSGTKAIQLKNDITPNGTPTFTDHHKVYGIVNDQKGFFKLLPTYDEGKLKCTKVGENWVLSWVADSASVVAASSIVQKFTQIDLPPGNINPALYTESLALADYSGRTVRVKATFLVAANNNNSTVSIQLSKSSGLQSPTMVISCKDGNKTGYITLEGEISILPPSVGVVPIEVVHSGESKNSAQPIEMNVNHYARWSFSGDATNLNIDIFGARSIGSGQISLVKLIIEKL